MFIKDSLLHSYLTRFVFCLSCEPTWPQAVVASISGKDWCPLSAGCWSGCVVGCRMTCGVLAATAAWGTELAGVSCVGAPPGDWLK